MTLATNIANAFTRVGTEFKAVRTLIGGSGTAGISALTTTDKSSLVAAINETKAGNAVSPPDASTTTKGIIEIATLAEVTTGTDTTRAVTPQGVKQEIDLVKVDGKLAKASNLSDLADIPTARGNLGLGSAATTASTAYATAAQGDLADTALQSGSGFNTPGGWLKLDGDGTAPDNRIPASIARDSEVTAAVAAKPDLGETSDAAYRGDRGKEAYDHSQLVTGNPHGVTAAQVGAAPLDSPRLHRHPDRTDSHGWHEHDAGGNHGVRGGIGRWQCCDRRYLRR